MSIGKRIKQTRIDLGISQAKLGEKLGVTQQMIGIYENGQRNPKKETLEKIAEALGVTAEYLLGTESNGANFTSFLWDDPFSVAGFDVIPIGKDLYKIRNYVEKYYFSVNKEELERIADSVVDYLGYKIETLKKTKEVFYEGADTSDEPNSEEVD